MSIISALIMLPFSFTANSALSATTTKTIQGTAPRLSDVLELEIANQAFSRFGFTYNGASLPEGHNFLPSTTSPSSLKSALKSTLNETLSGNEAKDIDGDGNFGLKGIIGSGDSATEISSTDLTIKIRDKENNDITGETKTFCELSRINPGPYKIEISNNLRLTTEYGDPSYKDYTATTAETLLNQPSKQYAVNIAGICYLKTASMQIYTGTEGVDIKYAIGYKDTKFDPTNGFKVKSGFPTTGFYKAVFSLIGAGDDQKDYKCERESGGNWVNYSTSSASDKLGEGCEITYNVVTKPSESITIKMSYKGTKVDSFTIPVPTKWAIGKGQYAYKSSDGNLTTDGIFPAASMCRNNTTTSVTSLIAARTYFFKRNELTNSPYASQTNYPEWSVPSLIYSDRFSRDTDGEKSTFMGEWGYVRNYSGSGWASSDYYWTAETVSATHLFSVSTLGTVHVYVSYPGNPDLVAICKG